MNESGIFPVMYIENLVEHFEKTLLQNYPDLPAGDIKEFLRTKLTAKKYDVQDEAIIEAILKLEKHTLEESFEESLDNRLEQMEFSESRAEFISSQKGKELVVEMYVTALEYLIDYFYTGALGRHLGSS